MRIAEVLVPWVSGIASGLQNHLLRFDPGRNLKDIT